MEKIVKYLLFIIVLSSVMYSCKPEEDTPDTGDPRDKLEGSWLCDESATPVTKELLEFYHVYIDKDPNDTIGILINNFHDLGSESEYDARAKINGTSIQITYQILGEYIVEEGYGTISGNYSTINMQYIIDVGDEVNNVTVLYTKQ